MTIDHILGFLLIGVIIIVLDILSATWLKGLHIPQAERGIRSHTDQTGNEVSFELIFFTIAGFVIGLIVESTELSLVRAGLAGLFIFGVLMMLMLPKQLWLPACVSYTVGLGFGVAMLNDDLLAASTIVGTFIILTLVGAITIGPLNMLTKSKS